MKLAVIGLGKMGLVHACTLSLFPEVELTVLCDKSKLIRRFCKKMFHKTHIIDDIEKLHRFDINAVYITTPIPSHFLITDLIFQKEIADNVFVEKTLASTYEESNRLSELAKNSKGINMVGYMKRFSVVFTKAKDLLSGNSIGDVLSFKAYAYSSDFFNETASSKRASNGRGGVLKDLGAHVIDLALWYFGELQVDLTNLRVLNKRDDEEHIHFTVKNSGGLNGEFDVSWSQPGYRMPEFGLIIRGTKGFIKVNDDKVSLELKSGEQTTWYRHDLNDNVPFLLGAPEYYREDSFFIKSVLNSNSIESDFKQASEVDYIIDQVLHNTRKNQ